MDVRELIGEIAKKHDVLLGKNDPIFVTVFLNELILRDQLEQLKRSTERGNREAERQALARIEKALSAATVVLNQAADRAGDRVGKKLEQLLPQLEQVLSQATHAANAADEARDFRNASLIAAAVAFVSVAAIMAFAGDLILRGHC